MHKRKEYTLCDANAISCKSFRTSRRQSTRLQKSLSLERNWQEAGEHKTAEEAKAAGNALFRDGKYGAAIACYKRAAGFAAETDDSSLIANCMNNSAMALIKLERWKDAKVTG